MAKASSDEFDEDDNDEDLSLVDLSPVTDEFVTAMLSDIFDDIPSALGTIDVDDIDVEGVCILALER